MVSVGILGGTFDPPHNGHILLAVAAMREFSFDKFLFIPAADPPHKQGRDIERAEHRLVMLNMIVSDLPGTVVSEIEQFRSGPSYTVDTLTDLKNTIGSDSVLSFVIGSDAFMEIETWHHWNEVIVLTNFIVAMRKGDTVKQLGAVFARAGFHPDRNASSWSQADTGSKIYFLSVDIPDISSTAIRKRISKGGGDWKKMVPGSVASYIERHGLYR